MGGSRRGSSPGQASVVKASFPRAGQLCKRAVQAKGTWDSTAQHSTAQHSTAQHSTAQHSTATCTMLSSASMPSRCAPAGLTGTPMTGSGVMAATIPGRCAAPPAPAAREAVGTGERQPEASHIPAIMPANPT